MQPVLGMIPESCNKSEYLSYPAVIFRTDLSHEIIFSTYNNSRNHFQNILEPRNNFESGKIFRAKSKSFKTVTEKVSLKSNICCRAKAIMFESVWKYIPAHWPYISSLLIQIECDSSAEKKIFRTCFNWLMISDLVTTHLITSQIRIYLIVWDSVVISNWHIGWWSSLGSLPQMYSLMYIYFSSWINYFTQGLDIASDILVGLETKWCVRCFLSGEFDVVHSKDPRFCCCPKNIPHRVIDSKKWKSFIWIENILLGNWIFSCPSHRLQSSAPKPGSISRCPQYFSHTLFPQETQNIWRDKTSMLFYQKR